MEHNQITARIHHLQYISQQQQGLSHTDAIHKALDAGCRWIQLRVKDRPVTEIHAVATAARKLCSQYNALLIINDHPHIAKEAGADGLHLGLTDMPVPEARNITGPAMLIGGTANTWNDVRQRTQEGVDYIGLGPFRFTSTKQQLSPILGIAGYQRIMQQATAAAISLPPIIAIGGITTADVSALLQAGLHGIAISGVITNAADPAAVVAAINHTIFTHNQQLC